MSPFRAGVRLAYSLEPTDQSGSALHNPLFELLEALRRHGSIRAVADARGQSYRHVWGELKRWEAVLGEALVLWVQGQPARLTPYAERLLHAEASARERLAPHVHALRMGLQRLFDEAGGSTRPALVVTASHDLGLPRLQALAEAQPGWHVDLRFAGSQDALRALRDGLCTVAGFHVPRFAEGAPVFAAALRGLLHPGQHKLIGSHWRTQGWMHRPGTPAPTLQALAAGTLRLVNRAPGSGTRLLLDQLLDHAGLKPDGIVGYADRAEPNHLAVAVAVASCAADCGLGVQAAAVAHGLAFTPVVVEDYHLVCLREQLDSPRLRELRALLATPAWHGALADLPGYGVAQAGQVLSLTRALPWWHLRPKRG